MAGLNLHGIRGHYADKITEAVKRWEPRYWPMFNQGKRARTVRASLEWFAACTAHGAVHHDDDSGRSSLVLGAMCLAYQDALAVLDGSPEADQGSLDLFGGDAA